MIKVRFQPSGTLVLAQPGQSLFELARQAGVPVPTACVGKGTCGLCRVKVRSGEGLLSAFNDVERKHLGNVYFLTKMRLSCQARLQLPRAPASSPAPADQVDATPPTPPTPTLVEIEIPHAGSARPTR